MTAKTSLAEAAEAVGITLRVHTEAVPIADLVENPWNPNEMDDFTFNKVVESIRLFGWVDPPTCVRRADGAVLILDGAHRIRAAKILQMTNPTVNIIGAETEISPATQRSLTLMLNDLRGRHDPGKTAILIEEIHDIAAEEEVILLPYPDSRINDILNQHGSDAPVPYRANYQDETKPDRTTGTRRASSTSGSWQDLVFRLPEEAALVVQQALDSARDDGAGDDSWQCLEMICAEYLAGHGNQEGTDDDPEGSEDA